ncbi:sensor histidine kinase [Brevibacillus humidisoli]|uniref:cache domain-containing sensor histidine kinase n=1 Tax=Brevibacillus humidisoli TaxID=2895522 RepID=UPI001E3359D8|nr:sensor histidine kinase [Brevibacillus humidisoli]UFJ39542.1 sensor histidine kinase [Brevibacillus humidisoli]
MTNIRQRLLIAFITFIIIPLILLGSVTFWLSQNLIEKSYGEHAEVTMKAISRNIYYLFNELNNISNAGITNPVIQRHLLTSFDGEKANDQIVKNQAEWEMANLFFRYPAVTFVALYKMDGTVYKTFRNPNEVIPFQRVLEKPIMQQVREQNGRPVWIGPFEFRELTGNKVLFTQIRLVKDMEDFEDKAFFFMQVHVSELERIFQGFGANGKQSNRYMLVNQDGLVLFDAAQHLNGQNLHYFVEETFHLTPEYQSFKARVDGEESLMSIYKLPVDDWYLVSAASWESLTYESVLLAKWVGGILLLCLVAALLFNMLFVNRIARSIIQIVQLMKQVEWGDLNVRAEVNGQDETSRLSSGFNSLVVTIRRLLEQVKREQERKKKAELMLLQAQINPHFLFNTLESINVLAVQNEGQKVSQMIYRLGNILRISISGEEHVPIQTEIAHLKSYLEIQAYRFEELFDYQINIPESLMEYKVLKLTLQPLVENSIQHGFEQMTAGGQLTITAREEADRLIFFIQDNGSGIADEVLATFVYEQAPKIPAAQAAGRKKERWGLGVQNVADRLRIQYGRAYGIHICSYPGEGTTIKCTIPKYR